VKALTLWQPYASLCALGVKTIKTRSWPAPKALIGQRIAIHAATRTANNRVTAPACMNYRHLRWATRLENDADKHRDGTVLYGTRNPMARLTPAAVVTIRRLYAQGGVTQAALAAEFGVTTMTINRAVRHQLWTVLQ